MQTKARLDRAQREVLNSFGKVACVQQKKKKKKLHAYLSISKEEELQIEIQKSVAQS
jgi:hypothetical protein